MAWLKREKTLIESDPKELSLDLLSHLQASLLAKLVLVNTELVTRYETIAELSEGLPEAADDQEVLRASAAHLLRFTADLQHELARVLGRVP